MTDQNYFFLSDKTLSSDVINYETHCLLGISYTADNKVHFERKGITLLSSDILVYFRWERESLWKSTTLNLPLLQSVLCWSWPFRATIFK